MTALSDAKYFSLRTYRKSGVAVDTAVWFADGDDCFYVFSEAKAGKVKRLRNSAEAAVAVCDVKGEVLGEWHPAEAFLVEAPGEIQHALASFDAKYGFTMKLTNFFSRLTGKFDRRAYIRVVLRASVS